MSADTSKSPETPDPAPPIVIVGAGLAGLACAGELVRHGRDVLVLESGDGPGGRVRTDVIDGFPCDRGFQVYLPAYPTGRRLLDYDALDLRPFNAGSLIYDGRKLRRLADPLQHPQHTLSTAATPVITFADKLRLAKLKFTARAYADDLSQVPDRTTEAELRHLGFSKRAIDHFFRPFFGGVFLDRSLRTTARMLYFTFAMFSRSAAAWPATGMQAIPDQLASKLPPGTIQYETTVTHVAADHVRLADDRRVDAFRVVLATDQLAASLLLPSLPKPTKQPASTTLYYTTPQPPIDEPTLLLNGSGRGRVNTVTVLSAAVPEIAAGGRHLISVALQESVAVDDAIDQQVRAELADWLPHVGTWTLLHDVTVTHALPDQSAGTARPHEVGVQDGVVLAGDWRSLGSIEHALRSGRDAAGLLLTK